MVVHATQMSVGSPAGRVVTLMVSLSPIHRPVMALHMRPVYTVLLGHGQRGLLGGRVPVPVAPVHAQKSDLWRPIRLNDTEEDGRSEQRLAESDGWEQHLGERPRGAAAMLLTSM